MIFEQVGVGNAMCLGLTCRQLYAYFKIYHPGLVGLNCRCHQLGCRKDNKIKNKYEADEKWSTECIFSTKDYKSCLSILACNLTYESIMKGYRMSYDFPQPRMLNKKVYGGFRYPREERCEINGHRLRARYRDWLKARFQTNGEYDDRGLILPCPHNLGED